MLSFGKLVMTEMNTKMMACKYSYDSGVVVSETANAVIAKSNILTVVHKISEFTKIMALKNVLKTIRMWYEIHSN